VIVAVIAVPLVVVLCVALSRAVAAANTRLLTSRKGRDLALLSGLFIAVGAQLVNLAASSLASDDGLRRLTSLTTVLRWIPPAPAIDAVRSAASGSYALATIQLLYVAAVLVLVLLWWYRSLRRLMVSPDASTLASAAKETTGRGAGLARMLPAGRTGTVMERQFRYLWRDPRSKASWATALAVGLLLPIVAAVQGGGTVYSACWAAGLLGLQMYNQFGVDGSAFWTVAATVSTPHDAYVELRARALAIGVIAVPYVTAVSVLAAVLLHRADAAPETIGLALALLGCLIAVGTFTSVRFPYALPHDNAFANAAPGQGGLAALSLAGGGLAGVVLCLPVIGLLIWLHVSGRNDWLWLLLPLGPLYGLALTGGALRRCAPLMLRRLPEILTAVSKG
jgi:ABC-2 type transport system permease protein